MTGCAMATAAACAVAALVLAGCAGGPGGSTESPPGEGSGMDVPEPLSGSASWLGPGAAPGASVNVSLAGPAGSGVAIFVPLPAPAAGYEVAYSLHFAAAGSGESPFLSFLLGPAAVRGSAAAPLSNHEPRVAFLPAGGADRADREGVLIAGPADAPYVGFVLVAGASTAWILEASMDLGAPTDAAGIRLAAGPLEWAAAPPDPQRPAVDLRLEASRLGWTHVAFLGEGAADVQDYEVRFPDGSSSGATGVLLDPAAGVGAAVGAPRYVGHAAAPRGEVAVSYASAARPVATAVVALHVALGEAVLPGGIPPVYVDG